MYCSRVQWEVDTLQHNSIEASFCVLCTTCGYFLLKFSRVKNCLCFFGGQLAKDVAGLTFSNVYHGIYFHQNTAGFSPLSRNSKKQ